MSFSTRCCWKFYLSSLTLSDNILSWLTACLQWHHINSTCFSADMMLRVCVHRRVSWIGCTWSAFLTPWWKSTPSPGYRRFTHTKVRVNQQFYQYQTLMWRRLICSVFGTGSWPQWTWWRTVNSSLATLYIAECFHLHDGYQKESLYIHGPLGS